MVSGTMRAGRERTRQAVACATQAVDRGSGGDRSLCERTLLSQMLSHWADVSVLRAASPVRLVFGR
jgi:hypothetical protein